MCHVRLFIPQGHRPHKALHLHWLASETLSNKCRLRNHAFPRFALALARPHDLEHLILRDPTDLGQGNSILGRLLFALLLDCGRERFCILLAFAVEEVGREGAVGNGG